MKRSLPLLAALLLAPLAASHAAPDATPPKKPAAEGSADAGQGAPTSSATMKSPFKDAVALWFFGDGGGLKANGGVKTGIELKGSDRTASQNRRGDGSSAHFSGGYLDAGQGKDGGLKNLGGYEFTLHIRLRVPEGKWDAPIISKHGGRNKLAWQLYGRPFGSDKGLEQAQLNTDTGGVHGGPTARWDYSDI